MTCIYTTICSFPQLVESCCVAQRLSPMLCDNLEVGDGSVGERLRMGGIYEYVWLIHFVVQWKLTQHCKAVVLQ